MPYDIDVYENISFSEMKDILDTIRGKVKGKDESKMRIEIPKGFYLLLKHFIKNKNVSYPIDLSIPSDIEDLPIICIDKQRMNLIDDDKILWQKDLTAYRTRFNQIYLSVKNLSPIDYKFIEEYLSKIGFKFHLRMNENQFIVNVADIELAKQNNDKFQIIDINDNIIS